MKKKLLSIILAIAMVTCMIPLGTMTAFAEEFPEKLGSLRDTWWAGKAAKINSMDERTSNTPYDYTLYIDEGGETTLTVSGFDEGVFSLTFSGHDENECTITFFGDFTLTLKYESDEYGNVKPEWFTLTKADTDGLSSNFEDCEILSALPIELQNIVWEIDDLNGNTCIIDFGVSDVVVKYNDATICATLTFSNKETGYYVFGTPGEPNCVEFRGNLGTVEYFAIQDAIGDYYDSIEYFDTDICTWYNLSDNFFVTVRKPKDNAKVTIINDLCDTEFEYGQPTKFPGVRLTSVIYGWGATYRICDAFCSMLSVTYETTDNDYYCFADGKQYSFDLEEDNARAECPDVFRKVSVPTANPDLYYNGETQTGVDDGDGYTVTNGKAKEVGTYTATATINDGCVWYNEDSGEIDWETKTHTIDWEILPAPHTHEAGTEYMSDGGAHWLKCADADCPLKTVADYKAAFAATGGDALKTTLQYKADDENGIRAGRQAKLSNKVLGRTIIPVTPAQLAAFGDVAYVTAFDTENKKSFGFTVDCIYTCFYNNGNLIEADGEEVAGYIIIQDDGEENAISGYGYYRILNGEDEKASFMFDCTIAAPAD